MNRDHQHGRRNSGGIIHRASALSVAVALVGVGLVAPGAGSALADRREAAPGIVMVHGGIDGTSFTMSRDTIRAGQIRFNIDTANPDGTDVLMFKPADGATPEEVFADFRTVFSGEPAQGVRDLRQDAQFYGLAGVVAGHPASVTLTLRPGTYYLMADFGSLITGGTPEYSTLRVRERNGQGTNAGDDIASGNHRDDEGDGKIDIERGVSVSMTPDDRFASPRYLPAQGTIVVRNESDELHEMKLFPLKPGTTDQAVQAWLDAGAGDESNPSISGPSVGLAMISAGRHVQLSYNLPRGTYLMFCEVPDEVDGTRHIFMGMWKVITLR